MSAAEKSITTPAHKHKLNYGNTMEYFVAKGVKGWSCDACKRTSKELQQSHSYRCTKCDFDLCTECTKPVKTGKHQHPLKVTDITNVYANNWGCDSCGTTSAKEGPLSWHCGECKFDLCYGCTKDHKTTAHRHELWKADPKKIYPTMPNWGCDICEATFHNSDPEKPYHCARNCEFDLCQSCMKDTAIITVTDDKVDAVQAKMEKSLSVTDGAAPNGTKAGVKEQPAAKVFISYQWDIQDEVLKLKKKLEANKIACWMDTGKVRGGDDLKKEIDKGIRGCKLMVSCVTKAYSNSQACQQEVALGDVLKKPILPLLLESITWPPEGAMAMPFAPLVYVDCQRGLNTENLNKVLKTIQSKVQ